MRFWKIHIHNQITNSDCVKLGQSKEVCAFETSTFAFDSFNLSRLATKKLRLEKKNWPIFPPTSFDASAFVFTFSNSNRDFLDKWIFSFSPQATVDKTVQIYFKKMK